jgi:ParB-like chromosome segregation protein Spo0J
MLVYVPLSQIDDNPFQTRREYDEIESLAADIAVRRATYPDTLGLMQIPRGRLLCEGRVVTAQKLAETLAVMNGWPGGALFRVQLGFGHRRKRAFDHLAATGAAGYEAAVMPVYLDPLTDADMLNAVWSENHHRTDISAVEQAELLKEKLQQVQAGGGSQKDVAAAWQLDRSTVANKLRLLDLPEEVQAANREGKVSERQCLALLPVARLGELITSGVAGDDNHGGWGRVGSDPWGPPPAPADYIAYLITHSEKITSDGIREYQKRVMNKLGAPVPDLVAKTEVTAEGVVQAVCKGCPSRINQHCLNRDCLKIKQAAVGEGIARQAAEELTLPFSDDWAHFKPFTRWQPAEELKSLYSAGVTGNMVIGWRPEGYAARPFTDHEYLAGHPLAGNGRAGVAVGHALGAITAEEYKQLQAHLAETNPEKASGPDKGTLAEWEKRAKKITGGRVKRTKAAVQAAFEERLTDPELLRPLLALAAPDWLRNGAEPGDYARKLAEWVWSKQYQLGESRKRLRQLLEDAGLSPELVDPPDGTLRLEELAVEALDDWYRRRNWTYQRDEAIEKVTAARAAFDQASAVATSTQELRELCVALDEAAADVERMTAEKQEA